MSFLLAKLGEQALQLRGGSGALGQRSFGASDSPVSFGGLDTEDKVGRDLDGPTHGLELIHVGDPHPV